MNDSCNSKVIAQLRDDLTLEEQERIAFVIENLSNKLKIIRMGDFEYRKAPPIYQNNDFGAVCIFYCELEDRKEYFSRLEYFDFAHGEHEVAV